MNDKHTPEARLAEELKTLKDEIRPRAGFLESLEAQLSAEAEINQYYKEERKIIPLWRKVWFRAAVIIVMLMGGMMLAISQRGNNTIDVTPIQAGSQPEPSLLSNPEQNHERVLVLAVSSSIQDVFTPDFLHRFEAQYADVRVEVKQVNTGLVASPTDTQAYLDDIANLVSQGDVVFLPPDVLHPAATRSGYFLDLQPLVMADATLDNSDFYPAVWGSYQWEGGTWALPTSTDLVLMSYDPVKLDALGIPYPVHSWTLFDLFNAAQTATDDENSGLVDYEELFPHLVRGQLFESWFDRSGNFTFTDVQLLEQWAQFYAENLVSPPRAMPTNGEEVRLQLSSAQMLLGQSANLEWTLLPGQLGRGGMLPYGFGVSMGTQQPELAYELVKFLTQQPEIANHPYVGIRPARRSLDMGTPNLTPDQNAVVYAALAQGIPYADMQYSDYLLRTAQVIAETGGDAASVLESTRQVIEADKNQQLAMRQQGAVVIATPAPQANTNAGEVALNFGVYFGNGGSRWKQAMLDFAAQDPQVVSVNMEAQYEATQLSQYDCFFMPITPLDMLQPGQLLPLDPFINADPNFDRADVLPGVMEAVSWQNQIWGYPFSIASQVMTYDATQFQQAGAFIPDNEWTLDTFLTVLKTLKPTPDSLSPMWSMYFREYRMLLAALGAVPLPQNPQYPVTFTDEATRSAIEQLANLVGQGYFNEVGQSISFTSMSRQTLGYILQNPNDPNIWRMVNYPVGSQYTPLAFGTSAGAISANSQNPEACYRLLSYLGSQPELFTEMPARYSHIESQTILAAHGADLVDFYRDYAEMLARPNAVIFQWANNIGWQEAATVNWLSHALETYLADGGDLQALLADAEQKTNAYLQCVDNLPPYDRVNYPNADDYLKAIATCSITVDPSTADGWSWLLQ